MALRHFEGGLPLTSEHLYPAATLGGPEPPTDVANGLYTQNTLTSPPNQPTLLSELDA